MRILRNRTMRLIALCLLGITSVSGCGEDAGVQTPPIEEWCDIDRPREDCLLDEAVVINTPTPEEAGVLCESQCTRLGTVIFSNPTDEVLKALSGYHSAGRISIGNAEGSVRNLTALGGFTTIHSLKIDGNKGLESLEGLENLVENARPDSDLTVASLRIIDNPRLKSVSALNKVRSASLEIQNNSSLVAVEHFDALERARITIEDNSALRRIRGFGKLQDMGDSGILIEGNLRLIELDAFENVTRLERFLVIDNPSLSQCRAESLLAQLENEPEVVEIEGNDTDCP